MVFESWFSKKLLLAFEFPNRGCVDGSGHCRFHVSYYRQFDSKDWKISLKRNVENEKPSLSKQTVSEAINSTIKNLSFNKIQIHFIMFFFNAFAYCLAFFFSERTDIVVDISTRLTCLFSFYAMINFVTS